MENLLVFFKRPKMSTAGIQGSRHNTGQGVSSESGMQGERRGPSELALQRTQWGRVSCKCVNLPSNNPELGGTGDTFLTF